MITMLHLRTETGVFIVSLPVTNANASSPFVVTDIQGVGPVNSTIFTSEYSPLDGGVYQGGRTGLRNIVLTVRYNPNYTEGETVQTLRRRLYELFPPKGKVRLHFVDSEFPETFIDGYVEAHEPAIFSRSPEVQISIVCPDPYFSNKEPAVYQGRTGTKFMNPYAGSSDSGFHFIMDLGQSIGWYEVDNGKGDILRYERSISAGERSQISTERSNKYVLLLRNGTWINDLQQVVSGTLSMTIGADSEYFNIKVSSGASIPYTLTFTEKYIGL